MAASVIVVTHRPDRWLGPCLASVAGQADEIIVVDNASEGVAAAVTAAAVGARVLHNRRNLGFPAAVNRAVRAARGDVIALLNDDAAAAPGWLASAVAVLERGGVAAVAPKLLLHDRFAEVLLDDEAVHFPPDPRPLGRCLFGAEAGGVDVLAGLLGPGVHRLESQVQRGARVRWRWTAGPQPIYVPLPAGADPTTIRLGGEAVEARRIVDLVNNAGSYLSAEGHGGDYGYEAPDDGGFDEPAERFGACGAAMVVTAEAFRQVGPLAGRFRAYYEDLDWSWRARLGGWRIEYEPAGVVRHVRGATSGGPNNAAVSRLAARNRMDTLVRNAPAAVVARQFRRMGASHGSAVSRRQVLARAPLALAERSVLARRRRQSTADVWHRWAGVDETWEAQAPTRHSLSPATAFAQAAPRPFVSHGSMTPAPRPLTALPLAETP